MIPTFRSKKTLSGSARKRKGARRELQAKAILEDFGWCVTKAGGSLGLFDLVAIQGRDIIFIQVKSNKRPPKKEREAIQKFRDQIDPTVEVSVEDWVFEDGEKLPKVTFYEKAKF